MNFYITSDKGKDGKRTIDNTILFFMDMELFKEVKSNSRIGFANNFS